MKIFFPTALLNLCQISIYDRMHSLVFAYTHVDLGTGEDDLECDVVNVVWCQQLTETVVWTAWSELAVVR